MSAEFTRDHCKIVVAKILQTIGWHSINSTPLEVLTDILSNYIRELAKSTNDYANEFGQTEPNLDHLGLAFEEMGVNLPELGEYVTYVNFVPPAHPVPKYPLPKESNLNFLKPGSKEVVTRPIHINEHLPPMYPLLEEQNEPLGEMSLDKKENIDNEFDQFKKPAEVGSQEFKRIKREEESGRPTREISSVMMTTSGFLSPAREGRLPEAKAPAPPPEPPKPPSPIPVPELVPVIKKKPEKKKEKIGIKSDPPQEKIPKKANNMKDVLSIKRAKAMAANAANMMSPVMGGMPPLPAHFMSQAFAAGDIRMPPLVPHKPQPPKSNNFNKALAAAKAKTEKLNTTITPIHNMKAEPKYQPIDKLITEPDKKKINILRKISNVKHEKLKPNPAQQLMQQAHDIVSKISLSSDITIEPINPMSMHHSQVKMESMSYFDNASPPGTPPTPRTPEILAQSPPFKEKRKRKEKPEKPPRAKKPRKQIPMPQPHFLDSDFLDMSMGMGRPKTPDAHLVMRKAPQFPPMPANPGLPFVPFFAGPGLIPTMANSMLFTPPMPEFGKNPYGFPMMAPKQEPAQKVSPKPKLKEEPKDVKPEVLEVVPLQIAAPPAKVSPVPKPPPVVAAVIEEAPIKIEDDDEVPSAEAKKLKEHKKDKKDKVKKKNKKEKVKDKTEKKKLKEAKKEKLKIKKEKKEKKKAPKEEVVIPEAPAAIPKILLKVNSPSPRPETPEAMKKLNIKPVVKNEDHAPERKPQPEPQRESSPGLAQISALVIGPPKPKLASPVAAVPPPAPDKAEKPAESSPTTPSRPPGRPRIHPVKPKPMPKPKKVEQPPSFVKVDAEGNEVWICPACGQQDDGRPMIGCDGCDAWYHWVCVGIQVPPDENENWYCKPCLAKKNEDLQDRKKKRKKKDKGHS